MTVKEQMENFRYNVWAMRTNLRWTQDRLAEESGLSHVTICRVETASRINGRIDTVLAIANAMNASLDEMFNERVEVVEPIRPYCTDRRE